MTKKLPAKPPSTKKSAKKTSDADINYITAGLEGLTNKGQFYSLKVSNPYKTQPCVKKNHYELMGEVFVNPVPNDSIKVELLKCGYYVEFSKAYLCSIADTAHHQINKEDDNRTFHEESSEAVAHANMTQLVHQTMVIDSNLIWTGLMIVCLPIKSSGFIRKIRLCYYDTGHTITVQNPNFSLFF